MELIELVELCRLRPREEAHEDFGPLLWWKLPITEAPYCGMEIDDDFPDYVTHWTPLPPVADLQKKLNQKHEPPPTEALLDRIEKAATGISLSPSECANVTLWRYATALDRTLLLEQAAKLREHAQCEIALRRSLEMLRDNAQINLTALKQAENDRDNLKAQLAAMISDADQRAAIERHLDAERAAQMDAAERAAQMEREGVTEEDIAEAREAERDAMIKAVHG